MTPIPFHMLLNMSAVVASSDTCRPTAGQVSAHEKVQALGKPWCPALSQEPQRGEVQFAAQLTGLSQSAMKSHDW